MSRQTYVYRDGQLIPKEDARRIPGPNVMSDIPEYLSPLGTGLIGSRSTRREELKRHNCVEIDPGDFKPTYTNERFARKHGLPLTEE